MVKHVVVMGGTFDPIHHGHLIVARTVAEHFGFDRITLMPVAMPPHRSGTKGDAAAGQDARQWGRRRLAMIRLAIRGETLFEVSDLELRRPPPSYTIDTLLELRRLHGPTARLHWIVGMDMLEDLPHWRQAEEVVAAANIITVVRQPYAQRLAGILRGLRRHFGATAVKRLAAGVAPTPVVDISSTGIRRRVAAAWSIRYLTPETVVRYISRHGLYRGS